MVAPEVASESVTFCAAVNVPAAGENEGVAATGGGGGDVEAPPPPLHPAAPNTATNAAEDRALRTNLPPKDVPENGRKRRGSLINNRGGKSVKRLCMKSRPRRWGELNLLNPLSVNRNTVDKR